MSTFWTGESVVSILSISSSMVMDSGNYTCSLANSTLSDTVHVSVQLGDHFQQLRPSDTSGIVTSVTNIAVIVVGVSYLLLILL